MVEENWVEENRMIKHSLSWKKHFKYIKTYRLMIYANTLPKIPTEMSVIPVSKEICTSLPAEQRGPISGMKPVPCPLPLQWFDVTGWSSEGRVISESPTETDQSWCFWITGSVGHRHHWTSREPTTLCFFFFQSSRGIAHDCQMQLLRTATGSATHKHANSDTYADSQCADTGVSPSESCTHRAQTLWYRGAPRDWGRV